ncbi:energy transducer TonB [Sphingomonas sp. PL-96]|uniref:energy transducer TonB n=1 Tax=Sphingomonas sp. PL-96 TaxID=2887201 RepID=UPI001E423DC3|nr:energy transducer TonB [Sphingomonas sp. PL-96]MCC2977423.1 energy transducer TonB [Sphingomonas sp. PL-96]
MAYRDSQGTRHRVASAGAVLLLHGALALALLTALQFTPTVRTQESLSAFDVLPLPAPPPPLPEPAAQPQQPSGAAAPANRRARPKPVVAPPAPIPLPPPPMTAPPIAGTGSESMAGAAPLPGPGTGAGGAGSGLGSGGSGNGTGRGGGTPARLLRGAIRDPDYPRAARRARIEGSVTVRFTVDVAGRARGCAVMQSSGSPELDATTCRLIEGRYRYAPARDASGNPVEEVRGWRQDWWLEAR